MWVAWKPSEVRLVDLVLAPTSRGLGIGSRLLDGLCEAADFTGTELVLHVDIDNGVARRMYEHHGFVVTSADDTRYAMGRPPRK